LVLRDVANAAGDANEYSKAKGWSQDQAAHKERKDIALNVLVRKFMRAWRVCDMTLERVRESHWRAIALANYVLVGLQYPCIAINDELRRPEITADHRGNKAITLSAI
jgi:hypothetical protein